MDQIELVSGTLVTIVISSWTIYFLYCLFRKPSRKEYCESDVVIITGCDSGIGLELAEYFAKNYDFQVLACLLNMNDSPGHRRLNNLMTKRLNLHIHKLDITSQEEIDQLVKYVDLMKEREEFSNVIALINNAGILVHGEFDWLTWPQIENQVKANFLGTMAITRSLLHELIDAGGRIITFTSVCDGIVIPGVSVYSATKAALAAFTQVLGFELQKFGVKTIRVKLGDFAKLTNIMSRHETNIAEMWNNMDNRKRLLYEEYFLEFNKMVKSNMGITSVTSYDESTLFRDMEDAIFLENPPTTITITPMKFKFLYILLENIPLKWTYTLLSFAIPLSLRKTSKS